MNDLGDVQLGMEVPITVQCTSDGRAPATPDAAPILSLFGASGLIRRIVMAADNQTQQDGIFRTQLFLDANFVAGPVTGHIGWTVGGNPLLRTVWFRILPGGDADGTVIAAAFVRRPQGTYIVWQTDAGTIFKGRNPRSTR